MTKRLLILSVIGMLLAGAPPPLVAADETQPDIVVVMVDDLGAVGGCLDERILDRLPNIRELWLEGGLCFDQAFAETPLCCPGRATFLTGKHTRLPDGHGVYNNTDILKLDASQTIATVLHEANYHTVWVGKYLNESQQLAPNYIPPGWDHMAMLQIAIGYPSFWTIDNLDIGNQGHDDRYLAGIAPEYVRNAPPEQPMFMVAAPRGPHTRANTNVWLTRVETQYIDDPRCKGIAPWKPPSYSWSLKPKGFPLGDICRSMLTIDDMVGSIRQAVAERGRPTVWMFTSDNGMSWGEHGFITKSNPWSTRLPLYFAGSGVTPGRTTAMVSNIDFAPTLVDLAGTSMPFAHGESFTSLLSGGPGGRSWMLEDYPGYEVVGPWASVWWAIRTPTWRLWARWRDDRWVYSLHRLKVDPWEQVNRRKRNPTKFRELKAMYPY